MSEPVVETVETPAAPAPPANVHRGLRAQLEQLLGPVADWPDQLGPAARPAPPAAAGDRAHRPPDRRTVPVLLVAAPAAPGLG